VSGERSLDPENWDDARRVLHAAIDDCVDWLSTVREGPVWRETPREVKARLASPVPENAAPLDELLDSFRRDILPYGNGNAHPRFFGWVHGAGNVAGALGEMLAGFINCNVGGRDHVAVHVERQVLQWCKTIFGFPADASGLLTTGSSMATVIALAVARNERAGIDVRRRARRGGTAARRLRLVRGT
jgi:glutamate/tyrosine decarboxylase-like PLP-dependent enzyme